MSSQYQLHYQYSAALPHHGDCRILGVVLPQNASSGGFELYVEEIYSEDSWAAQHIVTPDGVFHQSVDEDFGTNRDVRPLELPAGAVRPMTGWHGKPLDFLGPRHRGLRDLERVADMVRPLELATKFRIARQLNLAIPPAMLLGLAESYVIAEAELIRPTDYLVCRRLRLAYALPEVQQDANGAPYDYDTLVVYVAHQYRREMGHEAPVETVFAGLPGIRLIRPMDIVLAGGHLFVADGGDGETPARIHTWQVDYTADADLAGT